jgi:D-psicose/D-tagatose/L-ribulose 3-epimerase
MDEKIKYGVTGYLWSAAYDNSIEEALPRLKQNGFDGIEIPLFRGAGFPAARIQKAAEAQELKCNVGTVLVDGLSLITEDSGLRRKTVEHLKQLIVIAGDLNARIMAGPVYSPVGFLTGRRRTEDQWKWAVESYCSLADTLAANRVTLAIEPLNRFETFFLNTAADAARLASEVNHPNVGILFDTFHANIEEKDVAEAFSTVGAHLKYVHTSENDRGIPGSGHVDWLSVFTRLRDLNYSGWLTIEGFGFALGDLSAAASIWRDIETNPESIAFDGIRFLKEMTATWAEPVGTQRPFA